MIRVELAQENRIEQLTAGMHIHLVGIGGSGLSAIALVLLGRGFVVSGSDMQESRYMAALRKRGATVYTGHSGAYVSGADVVLISSAIPDLNPEIIAANLMGIPVFKRAEFLGMLMQGQQGIAIAGTHGKTTTTSMVAQILLAAGVDPSVIVGSTIPLLGANGRAGAGEHFVIEADEYDHMFLGLNYTIAVVNNIEYDHPDIFEDEETYLNAFSRFIEKLPDAGILLANGDDDAVLSLIRPNTTYTVETVGLGANCDWRAEQIRPNQQGGSDFVVMKNADLVGLARLRVPGEHNVRNALVAIAVATHIGLDFKTIHVALSEFGGVGRRFQEIGTVGGVTVIDDYAHHPTEIKVTLAAAQQRYPGRTIWAVWQPHTYSRVKLYFDRFVQAFGDADKAIVLDI
ncbi:MAG TPA: UDP-N-acetylmuramate--L-alanine ligase, partial [Anaerolineae bacterium]|nr:UDP-N-acetylmuramate--L-alanine ligase [Anaerolineae bacterium]